ncbi:MAG: gamma-glutamylcyclotransferase [Candidatus Symbiodolus clandestinus]
MKVFVYGGFRRKQDGSRWMSNAQWVGAYPLAGYDLYDLGFYPAAVPGDGTIEGEVYRIDSAILQQLDHLKHVPREFRRQLIMTPWGRSWIYLYQRPVTHLKSIPSGDWLQRSS